MCNEDHSTEEGQAHDVNVTHQELLIADDGSDADSALGISDDQLSSQSLRSSIYAYQQENGRMYHALSRGSPTLVDIPISFFIVLTLLKADEHPDAEIIGVDLSPIQPLFVPPNCQFEVDDLEKEWTWTKPFDYIFSRMMVGSFADWNAYVQQAYDHLEPGGWIEMVDCLFPIDSDDGTLNDDQAIMKWINALIEASETLGRPLTDARNHEQRLIDAGYENVQKKVFKWPTNSRPKDKKHKEIGFWTLANIGSGLEGLSLALLTRGLNWTQEEVLVFLAQVRLDLKNTKIHGYWPIVVVYGQKPLHPKSPAEPV